MDCDHPGCKRPCKFEANHGEKGDVVHSEEDDAHLEYCASLVHVHPGSNDGTKEGKPYGTPSFTSNIGDGLLSEQRDLQSSMESSHFPFLDFFWLVRLS